MTDNSKEPKQLKVYYEKGGLFRVIHVDGAHGGLSPNGKFVVMNLYSERKPIPQVEVLEGQVEGQVVTLTENRELREQKDGFFREVEISAVLDLEVADAIHQWLERHIAKGKEIRDQQGKVDSDDVAGSS